MSTRSTSSNLFSPLRDPESLIRRRNLGEPSSLFDFEEVMSIPHNNQGPPPAGPPPPNNNGPPPMVRPNGPAPRSMEELCQPSINGRGGPIAPIPIQATDFGLRHHMIQQVQNTCQFHGLPGDDANRHIDKFLEITQHMKQNGVSDDALRLSLFPYSLTHHATAWHRDTINAAAGGTFMQKTPEECYELIENMTAHHNHWDTLAIQDETSRTISSNTTTESPEVVRQLEMTNKNFLDMMRQIQSVKSVSPKCETYGGPHSFTECPAVDGYTQEAAYATTVFFQMQSPSGSGSLRSNTVANPRGDVKAITTRSGVAYDGPTIPPTPSPLPNEVERETEVTKDKVQTTSLESTAHVQPLVVQEPIPEPKVALKPNHKPLHFDISFADTLLHMPKFAFTFKSLLSNKEKLFELANTSLNENCSAVLLKKFPKKLEEPDKFLIPCDFLKLDKCLALADLGASINLMPLSVWKKLSLSELTSTCMTLELANRSVPLILRRPFLRTTRALIDVHGEELTLRVNDEAITFKVGHATRYSHNYYDETVHQVNVIDVACEEYAQEVLGFLDSSMSGNPIPSDPIIATSSPSLTPFEGGDFILEEIKACLSNDSIPPGINDADFDLEGDIRLLEKLLNDDPSSSLPLKELNFEELKTIKSSINDPPELELKDLPSHLEYAFLEGTDK
ncbi:hypothetical protein Tco_0923477 [Tanacetum coccineum]|uniref:Reverse transcriptase domain-containing protein n=1 Tax=Tanacetum coccineum TaxID=301880 RepID=A0ABQ5D4E7_9ASTR